jgi:two-component system, NarL family, sensor histidine kinase DesK
VSIRLLPDVREIGWMPYGWLLYLAFLFIAPWISGEAFDWIVAVGSIALFLPLYFRNFWTGGLEAVGIAAAIALIGVIVLPFNWGANCYFIYSAAFFGYATRPRRAAVALLILLAVLIAETLLFRLPTWAWLPGAIGILAVGAGNIHFAEVYRHRLRLQQAQDQAEEMAKVAERERIARDLHDLLGHTLSVIVMKSELASKLADRDPSRAIEEIRDVERVSREALTEVRRAVEGYGRHGLGGEMRNAAIALEAAGVTLHTDVAPLTLSPKQETALALALRESITNVVRHAAATVCRVNLRADGGRLTFIVEDDGRGGMPREGNGLRGMRMRLAEVGGTVAVDGGRGMRVTITLPLRPGDAVLAS